MPRNAEPARRRLQQATLELFRERGYDATTTAEIAARAGVTERTFFRHFPDKREALFDGEEAFRDALTDAVAGAPEGLAPMDALLCAFRSVEPLLERNRPFTEPRQEIIARTPALQERVLTKTANLIGALAAWPRKSRGSSRSGRPRLRREGLVQRSKAKPKYAPEARLRNAAAPLPDHL
jgi:AcrR family transcriptional regulator